MDLQEQARFFYLCYKLISLAVSQTDDGISFLEELLRNPQRAISEKSKEFWEQIHIFLNSNNQHKTLATLAVKAVLLFVKNPELGNLPEENPVELHLLRLEIFTVDEWDKLYQLIGLTVSLEDTSYFQAPTWMAMFSRVCFFSSVQHVIVRSKSTDFRKQNYSILALQLLKLPQLKLIELSNAFLTKLSKEELHKFCSILYSIPKLAILNISNDEFESYDDEKWTIFCKTLGALTQLRQVKISAEMLERLTEFQWQILCQALDANPFLVIEELPDNVPEEVKTRIRRNSFQQQIIAFVEEQLKYENESIFIYNIRLLLELLDSFLNRTTIHYFSTEICLYLQELKNKLFSLITRVSLQQFKISGKLSSEYWPMISPESSEYLPLRIELFHSVLDRFKDHLSSTYFFAAFLTIIDEDGELNNLDMEQTKKFNEHLLKTVGVRDKDAKTLSAIEQITYLKYLFLKRFLKNNPDKKKIIFPEDSRLTTTTSSPRLTTLFGQPDTELLSFIDVQQLDKMPTQTKINFAWPRLLRAINFSNSSIDDMFNKRIAEAINLRQLQITLEQRYEQCITHGISCLQAFLNALSICVSDRTRVFSFNLTMDQVLLNLVSPNEKSTKSFSKNTRIALLQYLLMNCLKNYDETKNIQFNKKALGQVFLSTSEQPFFRFFSIHEIATKRDIDKLVLPGESLVKNNGKEHQLTLADFQSPVAHGMIETLYFEIKRKLTEHPIPSELQGLFNYLEAEAAIPDKSISPSMKA